MDRTPTTTVLRVLPRDPVAWSVLDRSLSVALTRLATDPDAPGSAVGALHAWQRLGGPLRAAQARPPYRPGPCPDLCLVAVVPADADALGRLAADLGRCLLPGARGQELAASVRAAAAAGLRPEALVVELARTHGLLDLDHGSDGELLHTLAGVRVQSPQVRAAHAVVAGRVGRMWAAGGWSPRPGSARRCRVRSTGDHRE